MNGRFSKGGQRLEPQEMSSGLIDFFEEERRQVFEPGPYFARCVIARLVSERAAPQAGIWDSILVSTRPLLMLALALLFAVLTIQILIPVVPARGAIEAYMSEDLTLSEKVLVATPPTSLTSAQLEELLVLESGQ